MAKRRRSLEYTYPDKKARERADEAVDHLPLDATMMEHIVLWEEVYFAAGGTINL